MLNLRNLRGGDCCRSQNGCCRHRVCRVNRPANDGMGGDSRQYGKRRKCKTRRVCRQSERWQIFHVQRAAWREDPYDERARHHGVHHLRAIPVQKLENDEKSAELAVCGHSRNLFAISDESRRAGCRRRVDRARRACPFPTLPSWCWTPPRCPDRCTCCRWWWSSGCPPSWHSP